MAYYDRIDAPIYYEEIMETVEEINEENPYIDSLSMVLGTGNPIINYNNFFPQPGEGILYAIPAEIFTEKEKTVGYTGGYAGASIRIAKGLTVHTGGRRGEPVKQIIRDSNYGDYILTNKRVVFISNSNGFEFKLEKITSLLDDGISTISIQSGRSVKNLKFDVANYKYVLDMTRRAIKFLQMDIDPFFVKNRLNQLRSGEVGCDLESIYRDMELFAREKAIEGNYAENQKNILNNIGPEDMKYIYLILLQGIILKGHDEKLIKGVSAQEMILEIFKILDSLRRAGHIHTYDKKETEILSNEAFLEKYKFFETIDFESDNMSRIKTELIRLLSIISYSKNLRQTKEAVDEILHSRNEGPTEYDVFLNFEKNKWTEESKDVQSYILTGLQYCLKNYNYKRCYLGLKCYPQEQTYIDGMQYQYTPYDKKHWIDFKEKISLEEFKNEVSTFYSLADYSEETSDAIEQYLKLHLKFLYNFVKTHQELEVRYKMLKEKVQNVDFVYKYFVEYFPKEWIVLKNVYLKDTISDIVVVNKHGVFTFYVKNFDCNSITIKDDGAVINNETKLTIKTKLEAFKDSQPRITCFNNVSYEQDWGENIISNSKEDVKNLAKILDENYPKKGFLFKKKISMNWDDIIKGAIYVPNNRIDIQNEQSYSVITPESLKVYFDSHTREVIDDQEIEIIKNILIKFSDAAGFNRYPVQYLDMYQSSVLSKVTEESKEFFQKYVQSLGGVNNLMNIGHSLTYYPTYSDESKPDSLRFVKAKECELFINEFFSDDDMECVEEFQGGYKWLVFETLNLDEEMYD
ncbi:MAG: hypothetical protein KHZ78_01995 [Peptoniphilus sp. oral taxon 375]|nr:hypothetical protein [Peptoniphilus sp. oral taxon 375]